MPRELPDAPLEEAEEEGRLLLLPALAGAGGTAPLFFFLEIASLTTSARPMSRRPWTASIAVRASSWSRIMTIAKPRGFPVSLSVAMAMSSMAPYDSNSRRTANSVTL